MADGHGQQKKVSMDHHPDGASGQDWRDRTNVHCIATVLRVRVRENRADGPDGPKWPQAAPLAHYPTVKAPSSSCHTKLVRIQLTLPTCPVRFQLQAVPPPFLLVRTWAYSAMLRRPAHSVLRHPQSVFPQVHWSPKNGTCSHVRLVPTPGSVGSARMSHPDSGGPRARVYDCQIRARIRSFGRTQSCWLRYLQQQRGSRWPRIPNYRVRLPRCKSPSGRPGLEGAVLAGVTIRTSA